ncbi:MAG TPA: hypothetical protein VEI06_10705 [Gemmatimonadaceae bacterium]|nr:hypothetical protein [Gemmatimonadaceae bacterium]
MMVGHDETHSAPRYDRQLLLDGSKRNAVLQLWEVERYGTDSFGNADYVSIFGMPPRDWYTRGVRLLGRTAVECTRDDLGDAIGRDIAAVAAMAPKGSGTLVLDPFAGSGNTLYWILRHLPNARGVGFELDRGVFTLTSENLDALGLSVDIMNADYAEGVAAVDVDPGELVIAFIAPPWGDALSATSGLDLRRTSPAITEIVDFLARRFEANRLLCAVELHETVDPTSLDAVTSRFDWSVQRIYDLNATGENHGILIGTVRWKP